MADDQKVFTQADLDAADADAVAKQRPIPPAAAKFPAAAKVVAAAKVFYHLYVCPFLDCLKEANPVAGSWHQRGIHLAQSTPRTDVKCPGCGKQMVIARDGLDAKGNPLPEGQVTTDDKGNAVMNGQPIVYAAPGQPDQTAELEKENAS